MSAFTDGLQNFQSFVGNAAEGLGTIVSGIGILTGDEADTPAEVIEVTERTNNRRNLILYAGLGVIGLVAIVALVK